VEYTLQDHPTPPPGLKTNKDFSDLELTEFDQCLGRSTSVWSGSTFFPHAQPASLGENINDSAPESGLRTGFQNSLVNPEEHIVSISESGDEPARKSDYKTGIQTLFTTLKGKLTRFLPLIFRSKKEQGRGSEPVASRPPLSPGSQSSTSYTPTAICE